MRVRTWSSPPSSARTSSILLDAPFSKCQGLTQKYYGPTIQPTTLTTPTNPSTQQTYPPTPPITFNHEGGVPQKSSESKKVLEWSPLLVCQKKFKPSLGLDLIDSQSSLNLRQYFQTVRNDRHQLPYLSDVSFWIQFFTENLQQIIKKVFSE